MKWINKYEAMLNPKTPILIKDKVGRDCGSKSKKLFAKDLKDENAVFWKYNLK